MSTLTEGNRLYLYRLLRDGLGARRQSLMSAATELIESDGIDASELGFADTRALIDDLSDFVEVITFRRGNTYAVVHPRPEWDGVLAKLEQEATQAKPATRKGYRRGSSGPLKPERPSVRKKRSRKPSMQDAAHDAAAGETIEADEQAIAPDQGGADAREAAAPAMPAVTAEAPATDEPPASAEAPSQAEAPEQNAGAVEPESRDASAGHGAEGLPAAEQPPVTDEPPAEQALATEDAPARRTTAEGSYPVHVLDQIRAIREEDWEQSHYQEEDPQGQAVPQEEPDRRGQGYIPAAAPSSSALPSPAPSSPASAPSRDEAGPLEARVAVEPPQPDLPTSISADVRISPEVLGVLYRTVPLDVDLMAALDQDWLVALGAARIRGTHARLTFPTRFLSADGSGPMLVTLQRVRGVWRLAQVDGDDGSDPGAHPALGIEGSPLDDRGAWSDLSLPAEGGGLAAGAGLSEEDGGAGRSGNAEGAGGPDGAEHADPSRALPLFAALGPWEALADKLAGIAGLEPWDFSGGDDPSRPILSHYLYSVFARAQDQGRVTVAPDGSRACFDTGLLSAGPAYRRVFLEMVPRAGSPAWQVDRVVAGEEGLGVDAPRRPSFMTGVPERLMGAQGLASPDAAALLAGQLDRLPGPLARRVLAGSPAALGALRELEGRDLRGQARTRAYAAVARAAGEGASATLDEELRAALDRALARTQADFRLAAPAFDARTGRVAALLPLDFADGGGDSLALAVEEDGAGDLRATAVVELRRAYMCARTVSSELPAWLRAVL